MKISTLLMMLFALCLIPVSVEGADIDGKWQCHNIGLSSLPEDTYFTFKTDGKTLSGTVLFVGGSERKISKGKINGNKFQFVVEYTIDNFGDERLTFNGVIKGDEIEMTYRDEHWPSPESCITGSSGITGSPFSRACSGAKIGIMLPMKLLLKKVNN
jgi:hypothetical protein